MVDRLSRERGALVREASDKDHCLLWFSVSSAPSVLQARAAVALYASAAKLLQQQHVDPPVCVAVCTSLARLARSQKRRGSPYSTMFEHLQPLLDHLIYSLLKRTDPDVHGGCVKDFFCSLGELEEACGAAPSPAALDRLAHELARQLVNGKAGGAHFSPQDIRKLLWACARLRYTSSDLLQPLAVAAAEGVVRLDRERMDHGGLAYCIHALAALGCRSPAYTEPLQRLMAEMADRLEWCPALFTPSHLGGTLQALKRLRPAHGITGDSPLVAALASELLRGDFESGAVATLSYAVLCFGDLGYANPNWYSAAAAAALRPSFLRDAEASHFAQLLHGLAQARRPAGAAAVLQGLTGRIPQGLEQQANHGQGLQHEQGLLQAQPLLDEAMGEPTGPSRSLPALLADASWWDCSTMLGSLARLGLYDRQLVDALAGRLRELPLQHERLCTQSNIMGSLWALAVLDRGCLSRHGDLVRRLLQEAVRRWGAARGPGGRRGDCFTERNLGRLWHAQQKLLAIGERELAAILEAGADDPDSLLSAARYASG